MSLQNSSGIVSETIHDLHDHNLVSLTGNLHAYGVIKPPFWL